MKIRMISNHCLDERLIQPDPFSDLGLWLLGLLQSQNPWSEVSSAAVTAPAGPDHSGAALRTARSGAPQRDDALMREANQYVAMVLRRAHSGGGSAAAAARPAYWTRAMGVPRFDSDGNLLPSAA